MTKGSERDLGLGENPEVTAYLKAEKDRQSRNLAKLFAKEIGTGQTEEEYIASLPDFELQPKEYRGRLYIPVIAETRIPLKRMLERVGIVCRLDVDLFKDWEGDEFKTPPTPYTTYLDNGRSNLKKSVNNVRRDLKPDKRGGTILDGLALYSKYPRILVDHSLYFPGSQPDSEDAICLGLNKDGMPELYLDFVDLAGINSGSVIAGRKIKYFKEDRKPEKGRGVSYDWPRMI